MNELTKGLSSNCLLGPMAIAVAMNGEHPCDRCNHDRNVCKGYPRKTETRRYRIRRFHIDVALESTAENRTFKAIAATDISGVMTELQTTYSDKLDQDRFMEIWKKWGHEISRMLTF